MSKIIANGRELRYQTLNEEYQEMGTPWLVFLHDGLGSIGQWKDFPETLSEETDLPALIYERHGHGGSEPLQHPREKNYLHHEALLVLPEVLDQLDIRDPIVPVGHSDGGSIALLFASHYPDRVKGLVTEAAHVFVEDISLQGIEQTVREFEKGKLEHLLEAYHDTNTRKVFYGWADVWLSESFKRWNIEASLANVQCPVLTIQGENDEYGTTAQVRAIEEKVSGPVESFLIPGCSHTPHHEQPEQVMERMTTFISSLTVQT